MPSTDAEGKPADQNQALALYVALRHLSIVQHSTVFWIDSSGEFSPERVSSVITQLAGPVRYSTCAQVFDAHHRVLNSSTLPQHLSDYKSR